MVCLELASLKCPFNGKMTNCYFSFCVLKNGNFRIENGFLNILSVVSNLDALNKSINASLRLCNTEKQVLLCIIIVALFLSHHSVQQVIVDY